VCAELLAKNKYLGRSRRGGGKSEDGKKEMAGKRRWGFRPPLMLYN